MLNRHPSTLLLCFTLLLPITGCATEDHSAQLLNADNPSQGQLIWDETIPELFKGWVLQCTSPADKYWFGESTIKEIKSTDRLFSFCDERAKILDLPDPFTQERADLEFDSFFAVMPQYKICSSILRYQMGLAAEAKAEVAISAAKLRKELGDFIGGSLDLITANNFQAEADYYIYANEESAIQISKTDEANICYENKLRSF